VLKIIRLVAGVRMAFLSPVVIRGMRIPRDALVISSIAVATGGVPRVLIDTWPYAVSEKKRISSSRILFISIGVE